MVAVEVGRAFGGEQVERGDAHAVQPVHPPAVAAVGGGVTLQVRAALAQACVQGREGQATRDSRFYSGNGGGQRCRARGGDRRVLLAQQALRLRVPGQDLGVQADPVRRETLPEAGGGERGREACDELAVQRVILE